MGDANVSGRRIVLPIAILLAIAVAILVAYTLQPRDTESLTFERMDAADPAHATLLDAKAVHADRFLEGHLKNCIDKGSSVETVTLRIDAMRRTLDQLTNSTGPQWLVVWDGQVVRISYR